MLQTVMLKAIALDRQDLQFDLPQYINAHHKAALQIELNL